MALSIKNIELEQLARELSKLTGDNITEVILSALKEKFMKINKKQVGNKTLAKELTEIANRCSKLKLKDKRTAEQILAYDKEGISN